MQLVLPMYNMHLIFPSEIWAQKCASYTAKYSKFTHTSPCGTIIITFPEHIIDMFILGNFQNPHTSSFISFVKAL